MIDKNTVRSLLLDLGVGDFNTTMAIPMMFMAPRTTDPSMVQLIVVIREIQQALGSMGAPNIIPTGVLDEATGDALGKICGAEWLAMPYYEIVRCVVRAEKAGYQFSQPVELPATTGPEPTSGFLDSLPAVPGGLLTYAAAGVALWWYFSKKKRRN